jgi:hypothetical protein
MLGLSYVRVPMRDYDTDSVGSGVWSPTGLLNAFMFLEILSIINVCLVCFTFVCFVWRCLWMALWYYTSVTPLGIAVVAHAVRSFIKSFCFYCILSRSMSS